MTEQEIADIAERVLRPRLSRHGFEWVSVAIGRDHHDDPAVFVAAHYGAESDVPSGAELVDAKRHLADYDPRPFGRVFDDTRAAVAQARLAVSIVAALDANARRMLATLLLFPTKGR